MMFYDTNDERRTLSPVVFKLKYQSAKLARDSLLHRKLETVLNIFCNEIKVHEMLF